MLTCLGRLERKGRGWFHVYERQPVPLFFTGSLTGTLWQRYIFISVEKY